MMRVAVYRGGEPDRYVDIPQSVARIGRAPENDVVLDDPTKGVSRLHAELRQDKGRWLIVDLNSQNGVWVGGRRVTRETVAPGTAISLGPFEIVLEEVDGAGETMLAAPSETSGTFPPQPAVRPGPTESMGPVAPRTDPSISGSKSKTPGPGLSIPIWPIAAVVLLILLGVGGFVWIKSMKSAPPPAPTPVTDVTPPPPKQEEPKPQPPAETELQQHVRVANERLDANDPDGAAAEIDAALRLDPNSADAAAAKTRLETVRASLTKGTGVAVDQYALPNWPAQFTKPKKIPNETGPQYVKRATEIVRNYQAGQQALREGRLADAQASFKAVAERDANFEDVRTQLDRLNQTLQANQQRADAARALGEAQGLERSGAVGQALTRYQRALAGDSNLKEAADGVERLRQRIDHELPPLEASAKNAKAYKNKENEAAQLDQILKLLPEGDSRRADFEKRLKELRSR